MDDSLQEELQKISDKEQVLILSFVAPDKAVKVSPIGISYASIDIDDLYEIERVVEKLEATGNLPKKLHLNYSDSWWASSHYNEDRKIFKTYI